MPTIQTERLLLRPFELLDLDTTHEYAGDSTNTEYMIHLPNHTKQETEHFLKSVISEWKKDLPLSYDFAVILDKKHIGAVSVYLDENRQVGELGWIIHKACQGNGYATEAAKAVLNFAFDNLKVKKVAAHCDYRNKPSYSVMRKIGLLLECDAGVRRYKDSDEDIQEFMYSLTAN